MLIRQDFSPSGGLPPRMYLEQILDGVGKTYCFLWDIKGDLNIIDITWKELSKIYNKNNFRTSLRKLNKEGLLNYSESEESIHIELVGWDEVAG